MDRVHGKVDTQTLESRATIAQLFGFTRARGSAGRRNRTPRHTGGQANLCLNGGASTRVPYRASSNRLNLTHIDNAFNVISKT